jgi:hypothetical protein
MGEETMSMEVNNMKTMKKNKPVNAGMAVSNENKKVVLVIDQPIVSSPQIDKMACVVDIPDPALHGQMVHEILSFIEEKEHGFKQQKAVGKYSVAVSILCPDENGEFHGGGPSVLFQATGKDYPQRQIRLSFNPYKLFGPLNALKPDLVGEPPVVEHLNFVFTCLWGDGFFSFLHHARVTYIEIWRHIMFRSPDDYLFRVKYAKTFQSMFGSTGKLETMYFGKGAGSQTAIYNKAKQLNGKSEHDCIRIEPRLKPKKMKVSDLGKLENPFSKVQVYSLKNDKPPFGQAHWIAFQDACRYRGIAKAIKCQPKDHQAKLKKAVSEHPVAWWAMDDDTWCELWHEALAFAWLDQIPAHAPSLNLHDITGE